MPGMITKFNSMKFLAIVIASILPLLFTIFWLYRNTQLPVEDAANYLSTALNIHFYFLDHGFWNGLLSIYEVRGWRPIIFPVLLVPFLGIFPSNLQFAYSITVIAILMVSLVYIYLYFRLQLSRFAAIVATNLVGLLPILLSPILMFFAESGVFPCVLASLYHLIKSDGLRNVKHVLAFILFLSLGLMIRPVETATHLLFVFVIFIVVGWRRQYFSFKEIYYSILIMAGSIFILIASAATAYINFTIASVVNNTIDAHMAIVLRYSLIASCCVTSILLGILGIYYAGAYVHKRITKPTSQSYLISVMISVSILTLVWFVPYAFQTYEWLFRTSLGDVALNTFTVKRLSFSWPALQQFIKAEGQLVVFGTLIVAICSLSVSRRWQNRQALTSNALLYLLLTLPFPLWEIFNTIQATPRKLSIAFPSLLMALLMIGLQKGPGYILRLTAVAGLAIAQIILALILSFSDSYNTPHIWLNNLLGYLIPHPVEITPNPHTSLVNFLNENANRFHLKNIAFQVDPNPHVSTHPNPVDPFLMSTMVEATRQHYAASYPYMPAYSTENMQQLSDRYDGMFLADSIEWMKLTAKAQQHYDAKYTQERDPSLKTFYEFLLHYSNNTLSNSHWKVGPCTTLRAEGGKEYFGCILVNSKNPYLS